MAYCPNCGAPVEETDAFCGNCATNLQATQEAAPAAQPVAETTYTPVYEEPAAQEAPAQKKGGFNVFALLGFVFSLVVNSLLGLIFSIIGLKKAKETGSGKGFAKAGLIISIISLIMSVVFVVFYIAFYVLYLVIMIIAMAGV